MKTGSGSDFVKMKGGNAEKNGAKDVETMAALLQKGMFSPWRLPDRRLPQTFEELAAKRVEFVSEPKDQFLRRGSGV